MMEDRPRILIVDDDEGIRRTLAMILERKQFEVDTAGTGAEALQKASERFYNAALVDVKLPDGAGVDLLKPFKDQHPAMELIVITGHASMETALEALNDGATAYITKPLNMDEILAHIKKILEKQELTAEKQAAERRLRRSEAQYRTLFEGVPIGLYRTTRDGRILHANQAMVDMLGYPDRQALLAINASELFVDAEDRERQRALLEREGALHGFETRFRQHDGSMIWVRDTAHVNRGVNGHPVVFDGSLEDITEQKQAQQALQESEARYRAVFDTTGTAMLIVEEDLTISLANAEFERLSGYARDEIEGKMSWTDVVLDEDLERMKEYHRLRRIDPEAAPKQYEFRVVDRDGEVRAVFLSVDMIPGTRRSVASLLDITKRKKAQEAVIQANARLKEYATRLEWLANVQSALSQARTDEEILTAVALTSDVDKAPETISLAYVETDEEGDPVALAPVAVWRDGLIVPPHPDLYRPLTPADSPLSRLWSEPPQEAVFISDTATDPRIDEELIDFGREAGFRSAIVMPLHSGGRWQGLVTFLWAHPRTFSEAERWYIERLLEPTAAVVAGRRAYLAQQQSEARYRALFNNASDAMVIHDLEGNLLAVNDVACRWVGYSRDELLGMTIGDIDSPSQAPQVPRRIDDLRERENLVFGTSYVRKDGTTIPVEVSCRLIAYGGERAALCAARDVSERLEMEKQLHLQQRLAAVGQLAGGIAHDFRNFLTTIILYAGMPLRDPDLDPLTKRALNVIAKEAHKASDVVQQILDFSGRSAMARQPTNLIECIEEGSDILRQTLPESIDFDVDIEPTATIVEADPTRIQQVLMNLVINARDAMPEGGDLSVTLSEVAVAGGEDPPVAGMKPGPWVRLTVSDKGTGMTEKVQARLFEPFFTTKEPDQGSGLGLAQVYGIVKQHHGAIDVETEVGTGTAFHIYLPVHRENEIQDKQEEPTSVPRGNGERILLVEDQDNLREAAREILTSLGYRVLTAVDGEQALDTLQGTAVDLVITDIVMPRMSGSALARQIAQALPGLPVLAVTGNSEEEETRDPRESGFADILYKPFDGPKLGRAVRRVFDEG